MIENTVRAAIRQTAAEISQEELAPLELIIGQQLTGRRSDPERPHARRQSLTHPVITLCAAAAMLAVVVGAVAAGSAVRRDRGPTVREQAPIPRYFAALVPMRSQTSLKPMQVMIIDSRTGKVLVIRTPPKHGTFTEVTGAADDHTFVIAARIPQVGHTWTDKLYVLRVFPGNNDRLRAGNVSFQPLAFTFPSTYRGKKTSWVGQGLALSAGGTKLAIAASPFTKAVVTRVWAYSIPKQTSRSWQSPGEIGYTIDDARTISWSGDGRTLEYMWTSEPAATGSIQLLDTASQSGDLISHSRELIKTAYPGFAPWHHADLTPDGAKLVAAVEAKVPTIDMLSASTGRTIRSLRLRLPRGDRLVDVLWANNAATTMVVSEVNDKGIPTLMLLRGHKLTRIAVRERFAAAKTAW